MRFNKISKGNLKKSFQKTFLFTALSMFCADPEPSAGMPVFSGNFFEAFFGCFF